MPMPPDTFGYRGQQRGRYHMTHHHDSPALKKSDDTTTFACPGCQRALKPSDLIELGLRAPAPGETETEYCDSELIDPRELYHLSCLERTVALS